MNYLSSTLVTVALLLLPSALHAQIITDSNVGLAGTTYTYDTSNPNTGVADPYWAQFGVSGTESDPTLMNVEAGASTAVTVSSISQTGDPIAVGVESTTGDYFQYDNSTTPGNLSNANGTSPQSSATSNANYPNGAEAGDISVRTGIAGDQVSPRSGEALTFTITFNQAVSDGELHLVANNYESSSTVNFSFSNGAFANVNGPSDSGTENELYVLDFSNVSAGSVLTITDMMTSALNNDPYANVSISGVAFPTLDVPEPSAYAMMLGGVALLMRLRRLVA